MVFGSHTKESFIAPKNSMFQITRLLVQFSVIIIIFNDNAACATASSTGLAVDEKHG